MAGLHKMALEVVACYERSRVIADPYERTLAIYGYDRP
jgi:hypothetical protein